MSSGRWVLHLDMDAFFASVEQLTRPTLRGRPVLVGGLGGRGVVAGASYEARVFGAYSAMPMHQARRMVGAGAVVLPPRGVGLRRGQPPGVRHHPRRGAGRRNSCPSTRHSASPPNWPGPMRGRCRGVLRAAAAHACSDETGLVASVGAGSGKQIAKIASGLAKPDGIRVVSRAEERLLLDGLSVRKLWGIGPVAEEKLHRLGIDTVGQLAALNDSEVASILGATIGPALHRLAQGIDDRPVAERAEAKQISAESTFAVDLTTLDQLRDAMRARSPSTRTAGCCAMVAARGPSR